MDGNDERPIVIVTLPSIPIVRALEGRFRVVQVAHVAHRDRAAYVAMHAPGARVVVGHVLPGGLMDALPRLGLVACPGAGLDKADLPACRRRGVHVTNVPDVSSDDVADHALLLMLAARRRLCAAHNSVRQGLVNTQDFTLARKASGQRVGIVGLGSIGMRIAKRAEAFNCSISYFGRSKRTEVPYAYYSDVVGLAADSDILLIACALTEETRHLIDKRVLDALGPQGTVVNIARGPVVDEKELITALKEGRIGSAGLDVFEHEPDVPKELLSMDNVVLTPHIASATTETRKLMAQIVVANVEAFFSNKPLVTPVY